MKRKASTQTIQQSLDEFIFIKKLQGVSKDTIRNYSQSVKLFLECTGLDWSQPFTNINQDTVDTFISNKIREYKPVTINHYLRDIRAFLNHYDTGIEIRQLKYQKTKKCGYSDSDVKKLLSEPPTSANYIYWKCWLIACIILGTGARIGSVVSLHKNDVDYTNKTIQYPHTKNGQYQVLPITDTLIKCIRKFENVWDNTSDWLVPNFDGSQSTPNGCHQAFDKYCVFVQIAQMGLHSLRHTFARLSVQNGMDLYTLNRFLGHSDIRMTEHYVNIYSTNLNTSAVPLDTLLKPRISRNH